MKTIVISERPGFDAWRRHARECLFSGIAPEHIIWSDGTDGGVDLFSDTAVPAEQATQSVFSVSREILELAKYASSHVSPERFSLLYRILWRVKHGEPHLLSLKTDSDVLALYRMVKAVRRDAYKIKAFLRFREVSVGDQEAFVAWYEPEHYSLEFSLPFFQTRFKNMTWSILTPYIAAHWDQETLTFAANPDPSQVPAEDKVEQYWLKYYASTFNPARPKKGAMLNQMPKKYWKNMPETVLIPDMLRTSEARARQMIKDGNSK